MGFDSVVFADRASLAALSCFARFRAERDAGRRSLLIPLLDGAGAGAIAARGLAEVQAPGETAAAGKHPRELVASQIRLHRPRHVMAPLGLLGAPHSIDFFTTLRAAMSVDKGRDLLFFEERPHILVREALTLRLSDLGARLPPATRLKLPRRHLAFSIALILGRTPPLFGRLQERIALSRGLRRAFRQAADWDPQRSLGPKLQPVTEPWRDSDTFGLYDLAEALGESPGLGSVKSFTRLMARHATTAHSRTPIERYWLSLPAVEEIEPVPENY